MALTAAFTTPFQQYILDALAGKDRLDPFEGLELGLFTDDPGEAGTNPPSNEQTAVYGYARQPVVFQASSIDSSNTSQSQLTNLGAIAFSASGGDLSLLTHAALFKRGGWRRSFRTETQMETDNGSGRTSTSFLFPSTICVVSDTLTAQNSTYLGSTGTHAGHTVIHASDIGNGSAYATVDGIDNPEYFVRIKSGPAAGLVFDIVDGASGQITVDHLGELIGDIINDQVIEIREKPTLQDFFGSVPASGGDTVTASGLPCGQSASTVESIYIARGANTGLGDYFYAQQAPAFAGGDGWRKLGDQTTEVGTTIRLHPQEILNQYDLSEDDFQFLQRHTDDALTINCQINSSFQNAYPWSDQMIARFRLVDSSGANTIVNITDGNTYTIPTGGLKLTLS